MKFIREAISLSFLKCGSRKLKSAKWKHSAPSRSSTYNWSTILSPAGRSTSKPSTHFVMSQSINSDVNILSGADEQKSFKAGNGLFHFLLLSRYKCSKIWTICGQNWWSSDFYEWLTTILQKLLTKSTHPFRRDSHRSQREILCVVTLLIFMSISQQWRCIVTNVLCSKIQMLSHFRLYCCLNLYYCWKFNFKYGTSMQSAWIHSTALCTCSRDWLQRQWSQCNILQ